MFEHELAMVFGFEPGPKQRQVQQTLETLRRWNFTEYAKCAVRDRPARMGALPLPEEQYLVAAEHALKIWYAALISDPAGCFA